MAAAAPADGNPGMLSDYCSCQVSKAGADQDAAVTRSRAAVAGAIAWWANDVAVAECAVATEEATGNGPAYQARPAFRRDSPPEPVLARVDGAPRHRHGFADRRRPHLGFAPGPGER
jgi:hypothetical protein